LRQRGFVPGSRWIQRETGIASPEEILSLGLSPNTAVSRLKRLRTADNVVMAIETTTIPAAYMPQPQLVTDSLYGYLDAQHCAPTRALQHIRAINANAEQAQLADIKPGGDAVYHPYRLSAGWHGNRTDTFVLPQRLLRFCRGVIPMSEQQLHGQILTPDGWVHGSINFSEKIQRIQSAPLRETAHYILPGFIDLHVHGAGGKDTMEAGSAVETIARLHAQHGTTSLLATTMTAPLSDIEAALSAIQPLIQQRPAGTARVLGVHLEGPYINPGKLGAQPAFAGIGSLAQVRALDAIAAIKLITLAPEMDGHLALVRDLTALGIRVQLGHSTGSYEEGRCRAGKWCQRLHAFV
jgi:hypothetical protein